MHRFAPFFLLAILAPAARADAPLPTRFDVKAIDAYLAKQIGPDGQVGLSVAVVQDGKVVLAKAYGKRLLDPATDADENTPFAAGSITKQFTAACIFLLA